MSGGFDAFPDTLYAFLNTLCAFLSTCVCFLHIHWLKWAQAQWAIMGPYGAGPGPTGILAEEPLPKCQSAPQWSSSLKVTMARADKTLQA